MIKHIISAAFLLLICLNTRAQTPGEGKAEINSAPPALAPPAEKINPAGTTKSPVAIPPRKISYGLSAGTQFSRLYGTTTFLEPSVLFPVTKRFSGFASLNLVTSFGANANLYGNDAFAANYTPGYNQRFILNAGGNYLVNDRLNLTGTVWRDFSKNPMPALLNLYIPGGRNGLSLRANYKVTENFSVSGGVRYSNGNAYNQMWYNPASPWSY
ncbi:hypothetical protein AAE02nite_39500 [Adhaeribacter aerolatus]|uniref:Outer membrane protein beta-barrel domain-containing protein n=1 Tax=Adhaeribacter aerolatus TaxID=670289 RepID=A0A512B2U2_9BACT|nr:hypothetical protein [Adhaeribacter aerolatus]GEO06286.1 hypothetical protein AAE02nite_39500 [Adhaeribacter aerolatus]